MTGILSLITVETMAELKAMPVDNKAILFLIGKASAGDGMGGFYRFDAASTAAEETTFMNVVASDQVSTGRWLRIFQRARSLPQGVLVANGGVKTLYVPTVISANSDAKVFLTDNNTASGNKLFTEIWKNDSRAQTSATTASNGVSTFIKETAEDTNLVYTTHGYFKANPLTITLGLVYNPVNAAPAGTRTLFEIVGV